MDKRGIEFLARKTLVLLISVLCLLLLLVIAWKLYSLASDQNKLNQAENTLAEIEVLIGNLNEGESEEYIITSPKKWFLTSFPQSQGIWIWHNNNYIPSKCNSQKWTKCLCICEYEGVPTVNAWERIKACDIMGVCNALPSDKNTAVYTNINFWNNNEGIYIEDPPLEVSIILEQSNIIKIELKRDFWGRALPY
ncbi:MAG: hypothetical protein ABIH72_04440 [archaeon]